MESVFTFENVEQFCKPDFCHDGILLIDDLRHMSLGTQPVYLSDVVLVAIVRSGHMHIEIDGDEYEVTPRHIMFCRSGHSLGRPSYSSDFSGHAVLVSIRFGQQILAVTGNIWRYIVQADSNPVMPLPEASLSTLRAYYVLIKEEVARKDNICYVEIVTSIIRALLCSLVNDITRSDFMDRSSATSQGAEYEGSPQVLSIFQKFIYILNNERCTERKLEYYANRLCVTPKYLSLVCKRVSSRTAHEWIRDSIVNGIDNYLRYSDKTVKEIANLYGFPNLSFFSKYVKKYLGVSPTKYRDK